MSHPRDWPTLPCPECGRGLLCTALATAEVIDCPGVAVRVVNGENLITIPARDAAYCNYVPCSWKGTISEAKKRKAEDSNPNAVKRPTG